LKHGPARLVFPALRWSADGRYVAEHYSVEKALRAGVGGFILFGGSPDAARQITEETQSRCDHALLFGSDMERGAGQQLTGFTALPPNGALGFVDDADVTRRGAEITAREARSAGINLVFAPVADLDTERRNPIVGTRSFGADPSRVARHVSAWVHGCHSGRALACAKHFPGHGRTIDDSHSALPHVTTSAATLEHDLDPFRAAIAAGVDAVMTAHVMFDAIDRANPATLSAAITTDLLRNVLGFEGITITDGLGMKGILDAAGGDEARAAMSAVNAGCDVLLYPEDCERTIDAMIAESGRKLSSRRVVEARERIARAAERVVGVHADSSRDEEMQWTLDAAVRAVHALHGSVHVARFVDVITIDEDLGGPHAPPSRDAFIHALANHGFDVRSAVSGAHARTADGSRTTLIAIYSDVRAWKGAPVLSGAARTKVREIRMTSPDAIVVLFGHPRLAEDLAEDLAESNTVVAWGGEHIMQRAAAKWLAQTGGRA
jgi:beta-glucosidase-like glycosyl hydrolase